jgi:hypothetical protein
VLLKRHGEKPPPFAYAALAPVTVSGASVTVDVQGIKGLQLESDAGPLDPRRAFQPFGGERSSLALCRSPVRGTA